MNENTPQKPSLLSKLTFFKRLKSIKHFELVIAITLGAIIIAIYFSSFGSSPSGTSPKSTTQIEYTNASQYAQELEEKLSNLISKIKGVGKADVYDFRNKAFVNAVVQGIKKKEERQALIKMITELDPTKKALIIADRGYESYNVFAACIENYKDFIIRIKDIGSNGVMASHAHKIYSGGKIW